MDEGLGKRVFKSNAGALLDLKAELLTRKRDTKRQTAQVGKASVLTLTKQEKHANADKAQRRQDRIRQHEDLIRKETEEREHQRKTMEEKSRLYDRMQGGEELVYGNGSKAEFLVNFDAKQSRRYGDSDSEDEDRSRKRERSPTPPLIQHFDPNDERTRIFGPSHVPLPKNEDERQQKIKEIKELSEKTAQTRQKRKKQLDEKKRAEREKLKKFRARLNLSPLPSSSEEEDDEPEEPTDNAGPSTSEEQMDPEEKRRRYGVREWDNEKFGHNTWIQKQRDVRENDFAPPSFY